MDLDISAIARIRRAVAPFAAVVVAACSAGPPDPAHGPVAPEIVTSGFADACEIILAPSVPPGADNAEIVRYRSRLRARGMRLPYLERLGWAFINEARRSDESYLTLASETATCMEQTKPGSAEALLLRGHVLHSRHEFADAESVARRLVALRGRWFDQGLLGDVLVDRGKVDEAIVAYQAMMDERPGPEAYSRGAVVFWLRGDLDAAIELMRMAARSASSQAPAAGAWIRVRFASLLWQSGQWQEAEMALASAFDLLPDYPPALVLRGRMRIADGRYEDAIESLERAVAADPLSEYQWLLIDALALAGRSADAEARADRLVRGGASHDPRGLALYLATVGHEVERAVALASAELTERRDVHSFDALAWALSASGRAREARELSLRSLSEGTQDPRLFYHAAVIASSVGEQAQAFEMASRALRLCHVLLPSEQAHLTKFLTALSGPAGAGSNRCPAFGRDVHNAPAIAGISTPPQIQEIP